MGDQTDRQTDKTTRWAFTAYEGQWELFKIVPECVAEVGWQTETCPETNRLHYQGFIRTKRQCRFAQVRNAYPGVHIAPAKNWDALVNYCRKKDTAVPGTQQIFQGTKAMTMKDALVRLASHAPVLPPMIIITATVNVRAENIYVLKQEYWDLVSKVLEDDPDAIGLYVNPMYQTAWINTRKTWVNLAQQEAESLSITDEA